MAKAVKKDAERLLLYPHYTGLRTLDEVLADPKKGGLLWLEILLNDQVPWEKHLNRPEVRAAHEKACVWYGHFKTMIQLHANRQPLPSRPGKIDERDYRKLLEALNFVSD